mgnify:FL=1
MMSRKNRTRQEMEEEMRQLRKVFMTVRLMKADEVQGGKKGSAPCYAQWRRSRPCENCVARQALEKNTRKTRLEYFGQELYEITASCVQVDGQLCVLELTRKIDRSVLLDPENGERLLNSITDEREKRYRDPLTGAYNRTYYDENYRYRSITAGVAMLDMDDLKFSNDVYGSGAGNSVLETAVSTIRRGLSEKDRLIRYDGGRLLLLLPDHNHLLLNPELSERFLRLRPARFHNPGNHLLSFLHLCIHLQLLCRTLFRYRTDAIHHRIHHRLPSLLRCHQRLLPIQSIPAT